MPSGFQDNTNEYKIDVVYTQLGRKLKALNSPDAKIVKFALSDDGINYNLYNANVASGKEDLAIIRTPMLEAWTAESALLRNRLFTNKINGQVVYSFELSQINVVIDLTNVQANSTILRTIPIVITSSEEVLNQTIDIELSDATYVYLENPPVVSTGIGYVQPTIIGSQNSVTQNRVISLTPDVRVRTVNIIYSTAYKRYTMAEDYVVRVSVQSSTGDKKFIDVTLKTT
jgi:hypothetical protein